MSSSYVPEEHEEISLTVIEKGRKAFHQTQYQGFWIPLKFFPGAMGCGQHFEAHKDDTILITWLKALAFTIVNRTRHDLQNHPLLTTTPQDLVPTLEVDLDADCKIPDLTNLPSLRLFSSHLPYEQLPATIIESNYRIVYLYRNPKDNFVSTWHFHNSLLPEDELPIPIEEALELFCKGITPWGPFWDNVLGYCKASLERPERVMLIKYEELKEDPTFYLRRLAEFLDCPFSEEEEKEGVLEKIERLCSFVSLKSLEVNTRGKTKIGLQNKDFFRRGVVGDWENHLNAEMIERLDQLTQQKFGDFGFDFLQRIMN